MQMCSILLIHKPHYRQRRPVHERGTGITVDVSCVETQFRPSWSVKTRDQLRDLVGKARDWLIGDDVSIRVLCVMPYRQLYSPQNPTTDNKVGSTKQGLESQ